MFIVIGSLVISLDLSRLATTLNRFESLLSQLEIHGAGVSTEDANQKFLRSKGNQESRRRDVGNIGYKARDNERRPAKQDEHKSMVIIDGEGVDWTGHAKDNTKNYALMAFNSSNSGSDTDDVEDSHVNDRFAKVEGMHAVPLPMTGIYMPPKSDFGIDELKFTCGLKQSKTSKSDVKWNNLDSCDSNSCVETLESMPKPVKSKPNAVSEPKFGMMLLSLRNISQTMMMNMCLKLHWNKKNLVVWNKDYLVEYQGFNGGPVAFRDSKGHITGKGKIRSGKLDFEDVCFVKEIQHFNLFFVSQMRGKKNKVLFTDTECLVLSPDFKLPDENHVLLRVPRKNNMYSYNLENIVPFRGLACLIAKATVDESSKRHRRVLVTRPQNNTPYELITGKIPIISYIRPFGCHVTILNTIDHLGKFGEKFDEGFLVGYSLNSKASSIYNLETKRVEENLHIKFLENKPNIAGKGPTWLFDLNYLTNLMNYQPVTIENKANKTEGPKEANNSAGTQENINVGNSEIEAEHVQEYCVLPLWSAYTSTVKSSKAKNGDKKLNGDIGLKITKELVDQENQAFLEEIESLERQENKADDAAETLRKTFAKSIEDLLLQAGAARANSTSYVNTASIPVNTASTPFNTTSTSVNTASTPANTASLLRNIPSLEDIYEVPNGRIFTSASYDDEGAVADFKILESTVNKKVIETKWVYRNKKDERGVLVRNKARLVAQGHRQEVGIDYNEVFALVAKIEAIRIFLAFASYMGFIVYQIDVKSTFLYGKIDEEVYVSQPPGFIDPKFLKKVYKFLKALYGLHQAPRAWYATLSNFLVKSGYIRRLKDKTLFIKKDKNDIMLVQVYVDDIIFGSIKKFWCDEFEALTRSRFQMSSIEILKIFNFMSVKTASTPIETKKPLVKDAEAPNVDVNLYRSMIGHSKTSHLNAMKRIFSYLKGQPKLGLWYPRESAFDLEAYSDSDYARVNLDRKFTTGGC
uniref:Uncharacterized protein n=1 Tax=Tanacetum cinerariifolium TaxID=118510 RepID=A0A6L2K441_TANCI|nr:hypothetical protein [Tanacetum cinerariifolium]